jgi:hypothetical protein
MEKGGMFLPPFLFMMAESVMWDGDCLPLGVRDD